MGGNNSGRVNITRSKRTLFQVCLIARNEREANLMNICFRQKDKIDSLIKKKDRAVYDELLVLEAQVEAIIDLEMLHETDSDNFRRCFTEYNMSVLRCAASWKK